ncbi:MAG: hypothetical protein HDT15_00780 [Oscillibacter sp.]|nr:hypothetical protein [Oscillibacter sp.]MBD5170230.1 hypothetical protein [Oscillibacter sp.]
MTELYKKMYHRLFNAITDALRLLEEGNIWGAKKLLMDAQGETEEMYISYEDNKDSDKIVEIFGENV